ncbi:hydroxyacid dehydrogenase [Robbsia sp. KACC 23696]|uniref:hydroxyacid dehydrogenase n=1 Tax=Robbsia sp. KACC 23696 TaxID=3149231 RepID=UPI00325A76D9
MHKKWSCLITQPVKAEGWALLEAAGITVRQARATTMEGWAQEIADADAVITRDGGLTATVMDAAPRLQVIGNHGAGTNKIDVAHASRCGIAVTNTPGSNMRSVAEHAMALLLAVARRVPEAHHAVRSDNWRYRFSTTMHELHGKVLGIAGYGAIGSAFATMARLGFGMQVCVWSPSLDDVRRAQLAADGIECVPDLPTLLQRADVVSLHRPARPDTVHMIDAAALALMKPSAILLNTSRGPLIDEMALADALRGGRLFGAGLDVFEQEPPAPDSPLLSLPQETNLVCAPHVGGSTQEALVSTVTMAAEQVIAVLRGERPPHLVNPEVWGHRRGTHGFPLS